MEKEQFDEIIKDICSKPKNHNSLTNSIGDGNIKLTQGCFVVTGYHNGPVEWHLGYVVQIRKGIGAFGSDVVFIRHYSGVIVMHENQCFWVLSGDDLLRSKQMFIEAGINSNNEDYSMGYSIRNGKKTNRIGFIIR